MFDLSAYGNSFHCVISFSFLSCLKAQWVCQKALRIDKDKMCTSGKVPEQNFCEKMNETVRYQKLTVTH
jgi:hypothetical protein